MLTHLNPHSGIMTKQYGWYKIGKYDLDVAKYCNSVHNTIVVIWNWMQPEANFQNMNMAAQTTMTR